MRISHSIFSRCAGAIACILISATAMKADAQPVPIVKAPQHGDCSGYRGGFILSAVATPDLGGIEPTVLMTIGSTASLLGVSERTVVDAHCRIISQTAVPYRWSLSFRNEAGVLSDLTSALSGASTLSPSFSVANPGVYQVQLAAGGELVSVRIETVRAGHGWVSIGPAGMASGSATADVGRVNDLAFDPVHPGWIYASTAWGGVFKSINSGQEWFPLMDHKNLVHLGTGPITVASNGSLFVGRGDEYGPQAIRSQFDPPGNDGGLWRSDDQGQTWFDAHGGACPTTASDTISTKVTRIFAGSRQSQQIAVSSFDGVFRSTDGGMCWQRVPGLEHGQFTDISFDPRFDDVLWVGQTGCRSGKECAAPATAGAALVTGFWSSHPNIGGYYAPTNDTVGWVLFARAPSNPATVYMAISGGAGGEGNAKVVRTETGTDGRVQLAAINGNQCGRQCGYSLAIAADPLNDAHVLFGEVKLHHSTDGGSSYTGLANNGSAHDDVHAIVFPPNDPGEVFAATDGGVFRLAFSGSDFQSPAAEWEARNLFLNVAEASTLSNSPADPNRVAAGVWDNGSEERTSGRLWTVLRSGDGYFVSYDADGKRLYVDKNAGDGSDTIRYPDGADFGSPAGFEANPLVPNELWGQRLTDKHDTSAYFHASNGWRCGDPAPGPNRLVTNVDFTKDGHYFVAADDGTVYRFTLSGAKREASCGKTTALVDAELAYQDPAGNNTRVAVVVDPFDPQSAYAIVPSASLFDHRVVHLVGGPSGWSAVPLAENFPFPGSPMTATIAADPSLKGVVYVGTLDGLWAGSPGPGGSYLWSREEDVPETSIDMIQAQRGAAGYSGVVRAATYGRGMWERRTSFSCVACGASTVHPIPACPACLGGARREQAGTESDTSLIVELQADVDPKPAQSVRAVGLRITPTLAGVTAADFLTRPVGFGPGVALAQISYVPAGVSATGATTDGLRVEYLDAAGHTVRPAQSIPFFHRWRSSSASLLRVEADEAGPARASLRQSVVIHRRSGVIRENTPAEIAGPPGENVEIEWQGAIASNRRCTVNGQTVPNSLRMTVTLEGAQILRCETPTTERVD